MSDQSASIVGSDYDTPSKPVTFSFLTLARLFLRTWPDLKPQWKHSVAWFSLQFLSGVVVSLLVSVPFSGDGGLLDSDSHRFGVCTSRGL